jgi:GT2 family glycosyltransferase
MSPKVYIILVNYNGYPNTIECLESVLKLNYETFDVIVVDNSTDDSFKMFKNWSRETVSIQTAFSDIVLPYVNKPVDCIFAHEGDFVNFTEEKGSLIFVKSNENRGFAAGNNLALQLIKDSKYDYVWLLNNDTVVERDSLLELVKAAESSASKTGMWGSKLLMYYEPRLLQGVGGYYNKWLGRVKEIGFREEDNGQWDNDSFSFDYVIGAAMFVCREFIEDVGLMEEDYFLYYEELDWAIRGKQKGWSLAFSPKSRVFHKMGASIRKEIAARNSELSDFYSARNRIVLTRKYFPFALISLYPAFLKFVVNRLRSRQFSRILMLLRILRDPKKHLQ